MLDSQTDAQNRVAGGPSAAPVIEVKGLEMHYDAVEALRGVDLRMDHGEILAVLGPNGAGKTTMIEILEGFRDQTAGEVTVLGETPQRAGPRWRERIGVVLQASEPERELTVREYLALALVGDPELIFLDEPTTGFDPAARRAAWEVIDGLRKLDKSVLLTTHYMQEAEQLADRILVLVEGSIVAEGTPATLGGRDSAATSIAFDLPDGLGVGDLPGSLASIASVDGGNRISLGSQRPLIDLKTLAEWAVNGREVGNLTVQPPTLEDIYLRLTGNADE
jgi:ABC-2 type transport system ATP-binding protein